MVEPMIMHAKKIVEQSVTMTALRGTPSFSWTLLNVAWKGTPRPRPKAHNCLDEVVTWLMEVIVNLTS